MQSLSALHTRYPGLFRHGSDEDSGESDEQPDQFLKQLGWIYNIDRLANGNVLEWPRVERMNVIAFLNALDFYRQKDEWEADKQREALRQMK